MTLDKEIWTGCYNKMWGKKIVKAAYSHPAKFSHNLIYRIIVTGLSRHWWSQDTTILDPFAGVGTGGIAAADLNMKWIGIELEPKFVGLAYENFLLHTPRWLDLGRPIPKMIQGDSRYLKDFIVQKEAAITSPPYRRSEGHPSLGSVKDDNWGQEGTDIVKRRGKTGSYGNTPGQIGAVTSPPFSHPETRDRYKVQNGVIADTITRATTEDKQGATKENIARLAGITSPPWFNQRPSHIKESDPSRVGLVSGSLSGRSFVNSDYGQSQGQLGGKSGETYWDAIATILEQIYQILPSDGHMAWVVKPFVREGKIVDLPQMTLDLMLSIGFESVAWIDADFEGRKSFFRRLQESKGSPPINFETVLVGRKP